MKSNSLEHNLHLYPRYQAAAGFLPWLPVFFLFAHQHVTLADVLRLSAVYYFSVFLLEVPSGYFSDKFGRRLTLIISATFGLLAYCVFIVSDSFAGLAIGQLLLAGYFSFKTGSDNALLYDCLKILGRTKEYASREANGARWGLISMALAALLGGVGGTVNLTLPYILALCGSVATIIIALQFSEPEQETQVSTFFHQLKLCVFRLKDPVLLWLLVFYILSFSLTHIPAEFNQPYIKLLDLNWLTGTDSSAMISGILVAISMLGGVVGATISIPLLRRYGVNAILIVSLISILIIISGMASVLHPLILTFVLFRNFPMALSDAPLLAAISPRIESSYRATYLSLQSLAGRLSFSLVLLSLSNLVGNDEIQNHNASELSWNAIQHALILIAVVGLIGVVALAILRQKGLKGASEIKQSSSD